MKKIIIALVIVIGAIAVLPMIGNSVAEKTLEDKINIISTYGIEIKNENSESSYLNTKKHYELLLSDVAKFVSQINQDDITQIPLYLNETMNGLLVGMDIEYSNIPIDSKLKIDIYPLEMPIKFNDMIKRKDKDFYSYLDKLLQSKTFLYHINYNLSDDSFDGYIKNIDEKYEFANGHKLHLNILDVKYNGQGTLQALKNIHINVEKFAFDTQDKSSNVAFKMNKFNSGSVFESENSTTNTTLKSISFTRNRSGYFNAGINLNSIKLEALLKIVGDKVMFSSKSSVGEFKFNSKFREMKESSLIASGFNYDITLDEVDKTSYEKFSKLSIQSKITPHFYTLEKQLEESIINLFSKGFKVNIADLSIAKFSIDNKEPVDGFSAVANLVVRENADLTKSPNTKIIDGVQSFKANVKISKDFYALISYYMPMESMITSQAKEDANNMLFEIRLNDGRLSVNGKNIR